MSPHYTAPKRINEPSLLREREEARAKGEACEGGPTDGGLSNWRVPALLPPPQPRCRPPCEPPPPCPKRTPNKLKKPPAPPRPLLPSPHRHTPSPIAKANSPGKFRPLPAPAPSPAAPLHLGGQQDSGNLGDGRQEEREVLCGSFLVKNVLLGRRERGRGEGSVV